MKSYMQCPLSLVHVCQPPYNLFVVVVILFFRLIGGQCCLWELHWLCWWLASLRYAVFILQAVIQSCLLINHFQVSAPANYREMFSPQLFSSKEKFQMFQPTVLSLALWNYKWNLCQWNNSLQSNSCLIFL